MKSSLPRGFTGFKLRIAHQTLLVVLCGQVVGAEVDISRLPPPAVRIVDFNADVQPILQQNCLKCHGPERPKSDFRLDNRDSALKGGYNNADDIVPGDSAQSRLIYYVAHLVEDMEMPPPSQGEALTPEQIGLLRAWIDQGAPWGWEVLEPDVTLKLAPVAGFIAVHGDEAKFREQAWTRDGWQGGVGSFEGVQQLSTVSRLTLKGHALVDDYEAELLRQTQDLGFIRFGWKQYRKYYSDSGGRTNSSLSVAKLGQDLNLDIGRAWLDLGLALPDRPRLTLGYEFQYRDGDKSTLQWNPFPVNLPPVVMNNVLPNSENVSEHIHIIKFDFAQEIAGLGIEDNFRGEFYSLETRRTNNASLPFFEPVPTKVDERATHFLGLNTFRLEKQFTDWLFLSGGYLYSKLDGDASVNLDSTTWTEPLLTSVNLERQSHVFSFNGMFGPWDGFSLSAAVQHEWTRQTGFGDANEDLYLPVYVDFDTNWDRIILSSDLDRMTTEENVVLRYRRIPFTVLFAEARLREECVGLYENEQAQPENVSPQALNAFLRDTDATGYMKDFRLGFSTSPWRSVSWSAHYLYDDRTTDYDHKTDESLVLGITNNIPLEGYSAFITSREIFSQEVETKLTLRPSHWLKTTLGYKLEMTDYHTTTDPVTDVSPGGSFTSSSDAHIYSLGVTLTPWRRLYLSGTFSYKDTRVATLTGQNLPVVPYRGDIYSVTATGNWAASQTTDVQMSYSFSAADFSQSDAEVGVPLGIEYHQHAAKIGLRRKFKNGVTAGLQYACYFYDEPSSGGHNNYAAHAVFASVNLQLP